MPFYEKRPWALMRQALSATVFIAFGLLGSSGAHAQRGLPAMGDGADMTTSESARIYMGQAEWRTPLEGLKFAASKKESF